MIAYVYKPKRRVEGKLEVQRTYRGRYRLDGEFSLTDVTLDTPDKQVAQTKLMQIIAEKERERAGLTAPASERQAVGKSTLTHLTDFLADLETLGRAKEYTRHVKSRVEKLIADCGFHKLGDIASDKFVSWRSKQKDLSAKTLNEYLNSMSAFLNWMVAQERMASNPLAKVSKVDIRGRQAKRRAITPDELQELFKVTTPKRRLIYLAAIYTGLRLGELKAMVKLDLHLDDARPYVAARASTTKNRKEGAIPLHPALAAELREATKDHKDGQPVFQLSKRISRTFKADLLRAGIEPVDALGRKLDFHALRKTFGTRLAAKGVAQRLAQELMRHQDPKLTALNYTDETLLPTFAAVASLDWEGEAPAPAAHTDTHIDTQKTGPAGQNGAQAGTLNGGGKVAGSPENKGESRVLTQPVTKGKMAERGGFEPPIPG
ncbi:MAG: tyrosine-type recombinase/integrase [Verrucomicrobiales bacterium]|nr:tyrosine-type recombinase/integrase [Verrucomicrobiales bacterium]